MQIPNLYRVHKIPANCPRLAAAVFFSLHFRKFPSGHPDFRIAAAAHTAAAPMPPAYFNTAKNIWQSG